MNNGWYCFAECKPPKDGLYLVTDDLYGEWGYGVVPFYTASGRFNDPGNRPECGFDVDYWRELPEAPK